MLRRIRYLFSTCARPVAVLACPLAARACLLTALAHLLTSLALVAASPVTVRAARILHRISAGDEDGVQGKDSDGVKNGVVVWSGSDVHVTDGNYTVAGPFNFTTNKYEPITLRIDPGAIVKIAQSCTDNGSEPPTACVPPAFGGTAIQVADNATLLVDGALITDVRDDVGDDTDGVAATPKPGIWLRLSGSNRDVLSNSTLRYIAMIGHVGSIKITGNDFVQFGGISSNQTGPFTYNTTPLVAGATTEIADNRFEIVTGGPGALDLRGTSPTVVRNTFTGDGTAVVFGPDWGQIPYTADHKEVPAPAGGVTVIADNNVMSRKGFLYQDTFFGARLLERVPYKVQIVRNRMHGTGHAEGVGVVLPLLADVAFQDNVVGNFAHPIIVSAPFSLPEPSVAALAKLRINNNRFSLEGVGLGSGPELSDPLWNTAGIRVNAEGNYWGHESGPHDTSTNADGFTNARGQGLNVGNGIDYEPFVGASVKVIDSLEISATTDVPPPLAAKSNVTITVDIVRYDLLSTPTGTLQVLVRDQDGQILNPPGTNVAIGAASHDVNIPPIQVVVPEYTDAITVEARIVPPGDILPATSNTVAFAVNPARGKFQLECIGKGDVSGCTPAALIRGTDINAKLRFVYTSPNSSVHAHVTVVERETGTGTVLASIADRTFTAPAGFQQLYEEPVTIRFPLRDIETIKASELYVTYEATDDSSQLITKDSAHLAVRDSANSISISLLFAILRENGNEFSLRGTVPGWFLTGETPLFSMSTKHRIETPDVTNWQLFMSPAETRDASGKVIKKYNSSAGPRFQGLTTTTALDERQKFLQIDTNLPAEARSLRLYASLFAPSDNVTVAKTFGDIPVRPAPTKTAQLDVAAGPSVVAFAGIPVKLAFTSNAGEAPAYAEEYGSTFAAAAAVATSGRAELRAADTRQALIPIKRYWSVYDDLADNSFSASITVTYKPASDFPANPRFDEDTLVLAGVNPKSHELEVLDSQLDKVQHTLTAPYDGYFDTFVVASEVAAIDPSCADPNADGATTAGDALFTLRASVGSVVCVPCACDANGNDTINVTDALAILRYAVGQTGAPPCLPCE